MDQRKALVDALIAPPRNPTRMPQAVEDFAADMTVNPLWDVAKGVGAVASGAGLGAPEVGAGIMGAMGLMTPMRAGVLGPRVAQGIRAYHGSPHKFDKFSLDKIGTGEGAQAYGHGLYFADNEAVAKSYRDALAPPKLTDKYGNSPWHDVWAEFTSAARAAAPNAHYKDANQVAQTVWEGLRNGDSIADFRKFVAQSDWSSDQKAMYRAALDSAAKYNVEKTGHMYEVNINARPEQFLDWDTPIRQQSPEVQAAVRPLIENQLRGVDKLPWSPLEKRDLRDSLLGGDVAGAELYRANFGHGPATPLREAGIPGIKYLDQGSRDAGQGSYNYVVHDDSLIDILKRYGLVAAPTGAMMAQQLQKTEAQ